MRAISILCSMAMIPAFPQNPGISVMLGSDSILIGEQTTITITADVNGADVVWPIVGDTLIRAVEVLRNNGIDSVAAEQNIQRIVLQWQLVITAFDTGYWAIPPFKLTVGGSQVETEALLLHVEGVPLDSAVTLRDIQDRVEMPFNVGFWVKDNWYWFIAGTAMILGIILLVRAIRNKKKVPVPLPIEVFIPVHERYLRELQELGTKRLWQQGAHKEYQSGVTDLLRGYIEERYDVPALERTTEELLQELRVSPLSRDQQDQLANVLHLADMVKFAKALPAPAENEQLMKEAIRFIQQTAPEPSATTKSRNAK